MMAYSEDHIALAAEYALGTLDADERTEVETMMSADKDFAALVEAWERKLGVLNQMVGSVEPSPDLWEKIRAAAGLSNSGLSQSGLSQSGLSESGPSQSGPAEPQAPLAAAVATTPEGVAARSNVVDFSRQVRRWRRIASVASALAAALVALVAVQITDPSLLPAGIRPKAPPKDGSSPAFILSVDPATKNFTVRKVGATAEAGKSYELWLVSDKLQRPRSLGVIGNRDFTSRAALASYDTDTVNKATYAVTVEPEGGSPTGQATGPIVFTGKLIETVPPAAAPAPAPSPPR
jgi:anti-sigma-K factor RskA